MGIYVCISNWWDRTTGKLKEGVRGAVMDIDTIKAGIPEYTEQILVELENPETREEIGDFLTAIVGDLATSTFGRIDETPREEIFDRHGCDGTTECKAKISSQLNLISRGASTAGVEVLTTNGTRLQPGFFMFLAFCVFSLFVSTLMQGSISNQAQHAKGTDG